MDYGFIDNKDMIIDYHDDDDFDIYCHDCFEQVSFASIEELK